MPSFLLGMTQPTIISHDASSFSQFGGMHERDSNSDSTEIDRKLQMYPPKFIFDWQVLSASFGKWQKSSKLFFSKV